MRPRRRSWLPSETRGPGHRSMRASAPEGIAPGLAPRNQRLTRITRDPSPACRRHSSALVAAVARPAPAQQADSSLLTLDPDLRLRRVRQPAVRPARWLGRRRRLHHARGRRPTVRARTSSGTTWRPAGARSWWRPAQLTPQGRRRAARGRGLRLVARTAEAAGLHQHPAGLAAQHPRRLLGARPRQRRAPPARRPATPSRRP